MRLLFFAAVPFLAESLAVGQDVESTTSRTATDVYRRMDRLENELEAIRESLPEEPPPMGLQPISDPGFGNSSEGGCPDCPRRPATDYLAEGWSDGEYPTVNVTGFFHLDAGWFHQDAVNRRTVGDIEDGVMFRRARPAIRGNVTETISYILEFEFATGLPEFVDVWADMSDVPLFGNVRVGRWRQPFGMTELTSVRELPFLERATLFAFSPFRQTGIGFYDHSDDERMTWAVSAIRVSSDSFGNTIGDSGGYGVTGRMTVLPVYENGGERLLHFGLDYNFNDPADDSVRFANSPEVQIGESDGGLLRAPFVGVPAFVDSGSIPTRNVNLIGLEAAGALGKFSLQSELRWAVVRLPDDHSETFSGAYVQARYLLTDDTLPYERASGVFGRVVPRQNFDFHGGAGAWELTARWSYLDLNGGDVPGPGRRLNDLTFGVNWHLNRYAKLQFNYIRAFLDDPVRGDSDADVAALRTQVDF